jgi:hypothetical protein
VSPAEDYLAIPDEYSRWCGGLRWSADGEAVEYAADEPKLGLTFAVRGAIAQFLEGFGSGTRTVHFAYVLHLLGLLGYGNRGRVADPRGAFDRLAQAFQDAGRPLRNAGALCASLCNSMPRKADPPDLREVCDFLRSGLNFRRPAVTAELPSLEPDELERRVIRWLNQLSDEELRHWLKYGRGPIDDAAHAVTQEIQTLPRNLLAALALLEDRPRLAGVAPLVAHLNGALTLPARRLDPSVLPTGGYADVTSRGHPEQILPGQFALDGLEFIRRYAERELLYFHREEPRTTTQEELVLLVDQGIRTWGDVRLILAAAALALGKSSVRRKIPLFLATTANRGRPQELAQTTDEALGILLEASDFSKSPASALENVLADRSERPRDLVLLTHPRSLMDPDVRTAARGIASGNRLFSITVGPDGRIELSEFRNGAPIVLTRCRVKVPAEGGPPTDSSSQTSTSGWRGDVEPIGFPFRLGVLYPLAEGRYDFDHRGEWLIAVVGRLGLIYVWKVDGTHAEMVPRPLVDGKPLDTIEAVVGVRGGFVVAGRSGQNLVAAHYDFANRSCRTHLIKPPGPPGHLELAWSTRFEWLYAAAYHSIGARCSTNSMLCGVVQLGPARPEVETSASEPSQTTARRAESISMLLSGASAGPIRILSEGSPLVMDGESVRLDREPGTVEARTSAGEWPPMTPRSDGKPSLRNGHILEARSGGETLALLVQQDSGRRGLLVFQRELGHVMGSYPIDGDAKGFALSQDGRLLARRAGKYRIDVNSVGGSPVARFATFRGRAHDRLLVNLGSSFLVCRSGRYVHIARWHGRAFKVESTNDEAEGDGLIQDLPTSVASVYLPAGGSYDRHRFISTCWAFGFRVLVDGLGQVSLLNDHGGLIAMLYVFRRRFAAWLPDGTRLGPSDLIGGPATPDAAERIAETLKSVDTPGTATRP